ncbi:sigma factor-like helix-turn-helix DNA-binding protein [Fimbriiglobus ruber]|uniref:High-affnity carbon uptake protein Hat/HatR n=1 Tax=Fimbriiglobus ruber TaxID=1908690 RepID=A0A225DA84_9BACT|nr:sigma factor-like helix-turn-helix DNA-binding protein [Fimbriiglobus ruber]OWK38471.1 High-affnity carbon uptake protein Hat/HatR [Fimbriiglobus ruber]
MAAVPEAVSPADAMTGRELVAALDAELDRLPPRYREPLVLCYLEGLTRDEAAARLGVPVPTLKSQLERGRKQLADALAARGHGLGVALLAVAATSAAGASPPRLHESILAAAGGSPSAGAAALAREVTVNRVLTKTALGLVGAVGVAVLGLAFASKPTAAAPQKSEAQKGTKAAAKVEARKPELNERVITGKVLGPDGKPIQADLTMVWNEPGAPPQPLGRSEADGSYRVVVPFRTEEGGGVLFAAAPGCGVDFRPHGQKWLRETMTPVADLTLRLPKDRPLKSRVLDQQGRPVAGATVFVRQFSIFDDSATADARLKEWARALNQHNSPRGDRELWRPGVQDVPLNPDPRLPYTATTDKDGRFEIAGVGDGQLVMLKARGPSLADKTYMVLNRDGFDPEPINTLVRNIEFKDFPTLKDMKSTWLLHAPDAAVVLEPEKIIRGTVTDHAGKPRAGVEVVFSRPNKHIVNLEYNHAITGADGRYEIRGARKHKGYMVECLPDPKAGLLQCQAFADDTAGYEPVTVDLKCARGVVLTGTVKNKATGAPVKAHAYVDIVTGNPFVNAYPPFRYAGSDVTATNDTDAAGRFRVVTIRGPVVLMIAPKDRDMIEFKRVRPNPADQPRDYRRGFSEVIETIGGNNLDHTNGNLGYYGYENVWTAVKGCWCKMIDTKEEITEVTVDVELEPATKTVVKVVNANGEPVKGARGIGLRHYQIFPPQSFPETDTLTVYDLEPKEERLLFVFQEERKLIAAMALKAEDKNPVIMLGRGGQVAGRAVDKGGKPIVGLHVYLEYSHSVVNNGYYTLKTFASMKQDDTVITDANGEFRVGTLFPGQEFQLFFRRDQTRFGPTGGDAPKYRIEKHSEELKLGDLKLEPAKEGKAK